MIFDLHQIFLWCMNQWHQFSCLFPKIIGKKRRKLVSKALITNWFLCDDSKTTRVIIHNISQRKQKHHGLFYWFS